MPVSDSARKGTTVHAVRLTIFVILVTKDGEGDSGRDYEDFNINGWSDSSGSLRWF